jgi:hypothetical protein
MGYHDVRGEGNHVPSGIIRDKARKKLALPCKLCSWHKFRGGGGNFVMAWTLRGSTVMPCWETMNPRRHPTVTQNTHLRGFKWILY